MNVNQHTPVASPYGQPHPGYGQPSYTPLDGGYPAPCAPYNGPASAYQPGAPPQGKLNKFWVSLHICGRDTRSALHELIELENLLPASRCVIVHVCVNISVPVHTNLNFTSSHCFTHFFTSPCLPSFPPFLVFQVFLLSQAFPLRLWLPTQPPISPLLLT